MGRKRWIFEETGEVRKPRYADVFPAYAEDLDFVQSIGGYPVHWIESFRSGSPGPLKIIKLIKVEDIPPAPEPEEVTMISYHKFSQAIPANTIATITNFASKIAENGWHDVTFQTPCGKVVVFPKEQPTTPPLKPCPFCGGEAEELLPDSSCMSAYRCCACSATTQWAATDLQARAAWNRRTL